MKAQSLHLLLWMIAFGLMGSSFAGVSQSDGTPPVLLSGKYSDLHPEQKRLVDDWFRRLSEVLKKPVPAEIVYDSLPLSDKTTFGAVTHALLRTTLTADSGDSLGANSLTLIDRVDTVFGKVEGTGGDKQFRIYVSLKPGAVDILERSTEFKRTADNTVYHKGFPISYRGGGGTPSIQVSVTKDGKRGDIDVDYRSSRFPISLVNGHLSSSNSDIRAGDNDQRHNSRWEGVSSWWQSLFGFPSSRKEQPLEADKLLPVEPRTKPNLPPASAVQEFLRAWLVERNFGEAVAYFSDQALYCMEIEQGRPIDPGVARFAMLVGLRQVSEGIGMVDELSDAVVGVPMSDPRGKRIDQPYQSQFYLYKVREDLAERFNCVNRLDPSQMSVKAANSKDFGKYVGAVFYLNSHGVRGETVATLWAKQNRYWKLVSYSIEPEPDANRSVSVAEPIPASPLVFDPGDSQLTAAANAFFREWFLNHKVESAVQYLAPRSYACVNLYRDDGTPEPATSTEAERLIRSGMERVANVAGRARKLEEAIVAPQVSHPEVRMVRHPDATAFAMVAVPEPMAVALDCSSMKRGDELAIPPSDSAAKNYGRYYATGFRLVKSIGEASVLWLVWIRENDLWKISAYHVLSP